MTIPEKNFLYPIILNPKEAVLMPFPMTAELGKVIQHPIFGSMQQVDICVKGDAIHQQLIPRYLLEGIESDELYVKQIDNNYVVLTNYKLTFTTAVDDMYDVLEGKMSLDDFDKKNKNPTPVPAEDMHFLTASDFFPESVA